MMLYYAPIDWLLIGCTRPPPQHTHTHTLHSFPQGGVGAVCVCACVINCSRRKQESKWACRREQRETLREDLERNVRSLEMVRLVKCTDGASERQVKMAALKQANRTVSKTLPNWNTEANHSSSCLKTTLRSKPLKSAASVPPHCRTSPAVTTTIYS